MPDVTFRITALDNATSTINRVNNNLKNLGQNNFANRLKNATQPLTNSLKGLYQGIATISRVAVGFSVFGISTAGLFRFGKQAADTANLLIDVASKYQVSAESLQVYGSLIEGAGGSIEDVGKSISKLRLAMNQAIEGSTEYQAAFRGVGLSVSDLQKMDPESVLLQMASAFSQSNNEMAKQEVLYKLLGRSGNLWMETLNNGTEEYLGRLKEMRQDGALISQDDMIRARDFNDTWDRLSRLIRSIHVDFSLDFMKALEPLLNRIRDLMINNRAEIRSALQDLAVTLPPIFDALTSFASVFFKVLSYVAKSIAVVVNAIGALPTGILIFGAVFHRILIPLASILMNIGRLALGLVRIIGGVPMAIATTIGLAIVNFDKIVAYIKGAYDRITSIFKESIVEGIFATIVELVSGVINAAVGVLKTIVPDVMQPDWLENWNFSSPTAELAGRYKQKQQESNSENESDDSDKNESDGKTKRKPKALPLEGLDDDSDSYGAFAAVSMARKKVNSLQSVEAPGSESNSRDLRGQIVVKVETDRGTKATVKNMNADRGLVLQAKTGLLFGDN